MRFANRKLVLSALGIALLTAPASAQYYYVPQYAPAYTYVPQYAPVYTYVPAPVYAAPVYAYRRYAPAYTYVPAPVYAAPVYAQPYVPVYGYGPEYYPY
jgi:hypothetical protein